MSQMINMLDLIKAAIDAGIKHLTVYGRDVADEDFIGPIDMRVDRSRPDAYAWPRIWSE